MYAANLCSSRSMPSLPLFFVLFLHFVCSAFASCRGDYEWKDWQKDKIFFYSGDALLTNALNKYPRLVSTASFILKHIEKVENAVYQARADERDGNFDGIPQDDRPVTCDYADNPFRNSVESRFGSRSWTVPNTDCVTDFHGTQHLNVSYSESDVFDNMLEHGQTINRNIRAIAKSVRSNFSNPDNAHFFNVTTGSQTCFLTMKAAVRFGQTWHILQQITSDPVTKQLPFFGRRGITEAPTIVNGSFANPKPMCMRLRNQTDEWRLGTTVMNTVRGGSGPSLFGRLLIEDNPAVVESLERSDLYIQQAEDALTPSNIAILVLPLFLNVVPIALIAEVATIVMLLYTILSDVLTVIPLAIKGFELLHIANGNHRSVVTRISSSIDGVRSETAAAEIWAADCRVRRDIRPIGIAFITLAFIIMVFGILSEFAARAYVRRRKERILRELLEASSGSSWDSARNSNASTASQASGRLSIPGVEQAGEQTDGNESKSEVMKEIEEDVIEKRNAVEKV